MAQNGALTQEIIKRFTKFLLDQDYTQQQIAEYLQNLAEGVTQTFIFIVATVFSDEDMVKWREFIATNPTDLQQWIVLEEFYKKKTGEDFADLINRLGKNLVLDSVNAMRKQAEESQKYMRLSKKDKVRFLDFVENEDISSASKLLNNKQL